MIATRLGVICHVISLLRQFAPFPKGIWGLGSNPGNRMSGLCAEQFAVRKCIHLFSTDWKSGCGHLAVVFGEMAARNIQQLVETWGKQCDKTPSLRIGCCFLLSWSFGDCFPTLDRDGSGIINDPVSEPSLQQREYAWHGGSQPFP